MNDILQAAMIGGATGLLGSVLGSGITGYLAYKTITKQMKEQVLEARRGRLSEIRKTYMVPLSGACAKLQQVWFATSAASIALTDLIKSHTSGKSQIEQLYQEFSRSLSELISTQQLIWELRSRSADNILFELTKEFESIVAQLTNASEPIRIAVHEFSQGQNQILNIPRGTILHSDSLREQGTRLLLNINSRIEILLCGEES
jgi:hypothetical protein